MQKTIKQHLQEHFPEIVLDSYHGEYNLRFELGGALKNGTPERVDKVVHRVTSIYEQAVGYESIVLIIRDYGDIFWDAGGKNQHYLSTLVPLNKLTCYEGSFEQTYSITDASGNTVEQVDEEKVEATLLIGQVSLNKETLYQIMLGIANLEMGFDPAIPQDLTFYSLTTGIGFRMYDDRGCDVWSADKEKLRPLYEHFNTWILDYNRPKIDAFFK